MTPPTPSLRQAWRRFLCWSGLHGPSYISRLSAEEAAAFLRDYPRDTIRAVRGCARCHYCGAVVYW